MTQDRRIAAVVLTGGSAVRMGGADKGALVVSGATLLERALAATAEADQTVVVGPRASTSRSVVWTRESPPGGGPAAGVLAGLDALAARPALVHVLAVDMPGVTASTFERLRAALAAAVSADGAALVDDTGRLQPLAAVYRFDALAAARPRDRAVEPGLPMRRLVRGLRLVEVAAEGSEARDVDTWRDLHELDG